MGLASRIGSVFAYMVAGYGIGLFGGMALISALSSNRHDLSVEAAMTGAFVIGPLAAVGGAIAALLRGRRRQPPA
jgi:hypothetical protein